MMVRACIFLGAALYPRSVSLENPRFRTSKDDVEQYLLDPERGLGIDEDHVLDLFDSKLSPSQQLVKISEALQRWAPDADYPKDLIIYYVGHGCFVDDSYVLSIGSLHAGQEGATGLNPRLLANTLKRFRVKYRKFIFLDCCYAAEALKSFQSSSDALDRNILSAFDDGLPRGGSENPQWGTALFCASDSDTPARSPSTLARTMFTDSLLHVLESGDPRLQKDFSVYELAPRVWERLQETHGQDAVRPTVHAPDQSSGDISRWVEIFPNLALSGSSQNRSSRYADFRARNAQLETALSALQSQADVDFQRLRELTEQVNAAQAKAAQQQQEMQSLLQEAQSSVAKFNKIQAIQEVQDRTNSQKSDRLEMAFNKMAAANEKLKEHLAAREAEVAILRERAEELLSRHSLTEKENTAAPELVAALKPLTFIGAFPTVRQRRIVAGLIASSILCATAIGSAALFNSKQNALQVLATSQSLMQSQRLAKSVSLALMGSPQAFSDVKESTEVLVKKVRGLQNGSDDLAAAPASEQDALKSLLQLVDRTEKNTNNILVQGKTLIKANQALRAIKRQSSDLLEIAEKISSLKLQQEASPAELAAVGQLVMLTQRIGKSASDFLTIEGVSPEAVFLLGKDMNSFREIAEGLADGNPELRLPGTKDRETKAHLKELMRQYGETRTQAGEILGNLQGLVSAREAQSAIIADSESLRKGLQTVQDHLSARALAWPLVVGACLAIVLLLVATLAWFLRGR